jgi:hypothetical protein
VPQRRDDRRAVERLGQAVELEVALRGGADLRGWRVLDQPRADEKTEQAVE